MCRVRLLNEKERLRGQPLNSLAQWDLCKFDVFEILIRILRVQLQLLANLLL